LIEACRPTVAALRKAGPGLLSPYDRTAVEAQGASFIQAGAPEPLARAVAGLGALRSAAEIAGLVKASGWSPEDAGRLFHTVGSTFGFDRLRGAATGLALTDEFERRAVRRLVVDLVDEQTALASAVIAAARPPETAEQAVAGWSEARKPAIERAKKTLAEIEQSGDAWSFAKLTLAHSALREVAAG
jgi:glutamate dehydrogenase